MPTYNVPVNPGYEDLLTEFGIQEEAGVPVDMSSQEAQLLAQTQPQFIPSADDLQSMALQEQYAQQQQQALLDEDAITRQYEGMIRDQQQAPQQVDLSPMLALADAWATSPSNLAGSYKRPQSQQERNAQILALQEKLGARKEAAVKNRNTALKTAIEAFRTAQGNPLKEELMRSQIAANRAAAGIKAEAQTPAGKYKSMGAESKQKVGFITGALQSLTDYDKLFTQGKRQGYVTPQTPLVGKVVSSSPIDDSRIQLEEAIGRLASGGAINKDEEARFRNMIPTAADNDEAAQRKLALLRREFENKLTAYGVTIDQLPQIGFDLESRGYGPGAPAQKLKRLQELRQKAGQ